MKNVTKVNKAVFPVAGLGTRFLPATKAMPKEMLPIVDKPLIQYAVEEAYEAGIRHMVFVTGRSKRAIEDHFDVSPELEMELEASGKKEVLELVRSIAPADMACSFVRQPRALGLGHAVLCAAPIVGNDPFAVLLPDDLMSGPEGGPSVLAQMVQQFERTPTCILAVQEVPREHVKRYGIVAGDAVGERLTRVRQMVEKPDPESAPSRMGVAGRYVLTASVFDMIRTNPRGAGGEIQLTDGIARLMEGEGVHAWLYEGKRYDCGSKDGFLQATVDFALKNPELGPGLREHLRRLAV
ncbi:UTP--glucose-1-phosphate uridylyltransferase GalU [Ramlibacter sp.]|uniref:UTP--glucose-1-phosphate uridylyltransferase GalU n=1 Tax=Ramlibacter sp. TaxID=1917967 RepID=UPI002D66A34E|nr:UTP--glucose-1-phosphate uridylyltransferase GalU [Ramlibacter sp.]HYD77488.1 UTP--glucose-1-phosphate uridylyltransferase GalU [Ramlibacter sp.]